MISSNRRLPPSRLPITINYSRRCPVPYYYQLAVEIEVAIRDGSLEPGSWIESEAELAQRCHLSITTVRQGIRLLVGKGLLVRRRGVGTQVVTPRNSLTGIRCSAQTRKQPRMGTDNMK